ncbi:hypothetical protein GCM10010508_36840 [Streptomyces naganishii JCM 4654]|uniref:Uncharacterized protein n=1 Tax=Streptomyces naganishii JCM 4654 TaxID=1306179 RepID=A0A918Y4L8_9ACTN|nr:hypothetical protein GCM10010508_36840 [Streptomyces naganishii JCM 4654]
MRRGHNPRPGSGGEAPNGEGDVAQDWGWGGAPDEGRGGAPDEPRGVAPDGARASARPRAAAERRTRAGAVSQRGLRRSAGRGLGQGPERGLDRSARRTRAGVPDEGLGGAPWAVTSEPTATGGWVGNGGAGGGAPCRGLGRSPRDGQPSAYRDGRVGGRGCAHASPARG